MFRGQSPCVGSFALELRPWAIYQSVCQRLKASRSALVLTASGKVFLSTNCYLLVNSLVTTTGKIKLIQSNLM